MFLISPLCSNFEELESAGNITHDANIPKNSSKTFEISLASISYRGQMRFHG